MLQLFFCGSSDTHLKNMFPIYTITKDMKTCSTLCDNNNDKTLNMIEDSEIIRFLDNMASHGFCRL